MTTQDKQRRARRQTTGRKQIFVIGMLLFGILLVAAFIADMTLLPKRRAKARPNNTRELQQLVLGMGGNRYEDPRKGLFSIVPPAGWQVSAYPESRPHNVRFIGANGADISITASKVEYNNFNTLLRRVKAIEKKYGLNMNIESHNFIHRPAVKRTTILHHTKVISFDFVENNVAHHIQVSTPHSMFDQYEPILMDVINTYEPFTPTEAKPQR